MTKPKPDNREDNKIHLQQHIENTKANMQEAEEYLYELADELTASEKHEIREKNERRKQSIEGFKEELMEEQ
ncbi:MULTISPECIES: small acid-soluble spore protein Tlp [Paenibacillus]|uniref:small acid-soluble spore protein Tlp n=1 Tax=Paenibacillus TaxID=44249 RepID=UPI00203CF6CA|nr:small acid-soluble spore protein Tlp [Paenibacillus camelliae]